jgi:hypothetical protein
MSSDHVEDFLTWIEDELAKERDEAARHVDRAEALAELRSRALPAAQALRRPLTPEDVFASCKNEHERAELRALALRATRGEPAIASATSAGTRVESGVAF